MRVRLRNKSKPDNYTESCMVNVADGWRERNVWYPGRSAWNALKGVTTVQGNKAVLNMQKSAEVIVIKLNKFKRDEGPNRQEFLVQPGKEEGTHGCRKQERKLLAKG